MLFSFEWLQSFFNKKLPESHQLARLVLSRGFEVEGIKKTGKDWLLDISILSNRPDCLSHIGMAREIGAILGLKPNFAKPKAVKSKNQIAARSLIAVEIQDQKICPRYTAMAVAQTKVKPSPGWMARRLEACGLRAINNVVDATNYAMLETGQPLHAFDWDKLAQGRAKAKKIIVRTVEKGESIKTLDGKIFDLQPWMALIADESGPLALAGIKGGKRAEIDADSSTIILESASFDARTIRHTVRHLGLSTDASYRFERNIDASGTLYAAQRAAELIALTGGGRVLAGAADKYFNPAKPKKVILNLPVAETLLGAPIQTAAAKKYLEALGFSSRKAGRDELEITVPPRRADVAIAQDIVEEIGRIFGYEKIKPEFPCVEILPPGKNYFWQQKNAARDAIAAAGYSETRNYSFISAKDCQNFNVETARLLEITNPINADLRFLRPALLINLLKNFCANREFENLRQFEIGKIFAKDRRDEPTMLAGAARNSSFREVKGALEFLASRLRVSNFAIVPLESEKDPCDDFFDSSCRARILAGKTHIGALGRLHGRIALNLGIEPPMVFEMDFGLLAKNIAEKIIYQPLPEHPKSVRDISVDMPARTFSGDVVEAARAADDSRLIESFEIPGEPYYYPGNKNKNILFRFHLRSDEKTLSGQEIENWQKNAIAAIERNPEWRVKK
jgi:phenylalanyl-tRNA synthetase beta chain